MGPASGALRAWELKEPRSGLSWSLRGNGFWSRHRLNAANRTWHRRTISQLPFDMHIDTKARNCNFLSVFASLRGSLLCQWTVRCVAPSHTQCSYEWVGPEQGFPPDSWKMKKTFKKTQIRHTQGKNANHSPETNSLKKKKDLFLLTNPFQDFGLESSRVFRIVDFNYDFSPTRPKFHLLRAAKTKRKEKKRNRVRFDPRKHVVPLPSSICAAVAKLNVPDDTEMP